MIDRLGGGQFGYRIFDELLRQSQKIVTSEIHLVQKGRVIAYVNWGKFVLGVASSPRPPPKLMDIWSIYDWRVGTSPTLVTMARANVVETGICQACLPLARHACRICQDIANTYCKHIVGLGAATNDMELADTSTTGGMT